MTTPQEVAAQVAGKAIAMFERLEISILGVIENMSTFICPSCGTESHIFDEGGGQRLAESTGAPFLGEIPLDLRMRDVGRPLLLQHPDSDIAKVFRGIAQKLAAQVMAARA